MHPSRLHQVIHHFQQLPLLAGPLLEILVYPLIPERAAGLNGEEIMLGIVGRAAAGADSIKYSRGLRLPPDFLFLGGFILVRGLQVLR